jgi:tRNA (mo5U34)-methyltransferase
VSYAHPRPPGADLAAEIAELGPWFHNLHLPDGTQTAPDHPLGDFPRRFWAGFADYVPADLSGWTALDVGCNAGFYSFELARRGARVTAIDLDAQYLRQARWAAEQYSLADRIEFHQMQVYDLAHVDRRWDLVWYMGVFYHLRYPLLSLDILARKTRRLMMFQTMTMPGEEPFAPPEDLPLRQRDVLRQPGWPKMAFIENRVAGDPTNWWAADHACIEAMLRSAGFRVVARPLREVYLCEVTPHDRLGIAELNEAEYLAATGQSFRFRVGDQL